MKNFLLYIFLRRLFLKRIVPASTVGITLFMAAIFPVISSADEEQPNYSVLESEGSKQIRSYDSYFVAQTSFNEDEGESTTDAFRRLFRYITGENKKAEKVEMTAPVTINDSESSVEIEMTAPVTITESKRLGRMTFMVPSRFSESEIPTPTDPRVKISKVPARLVATHTFSWFSGSQKQARIARELREWLDTRPEYKIVKGPIYAGYNSPFSLPFLRTHEMMYVVEKTKQQALEKNTER